LGAIRPVVLSNEANSAWGGLPMGSLPMGRGRGKKKTVAVEMRTW